MDKLPAFPTFDLSSTVNWMVDGFTSMVSSNAGVIIGASLAMAVLPMAIKKGIGFFKTTMK